MPLPAGAVRVYEKDDSGRERYTGADDIADTPKKERVSITLSQAFDVYADYKVLSSQRISKRVLRKTVEATVHNEKKTAIQLRLLQGFSQGWSPVAQSIKGEYADINTMQWKLSLKAGEEKKVRFTVDVRDRIPG